MERIIRKIFEYKGNTIIEKLYNNLIQKIVIAIIVQFIIFLILQIIDLFIEIIFYDSEFFMFYYLRYLFFGFSLIVQIFVIISIIVCFSFLARIEGTHYVEKRILGTFIKVITTIYIVWTIVLISTFIPRIIVLMKEREKIGIFISTLIYLKIFIMISTYEYILIIYILDKEKNKKEDEKS